MSGAECKALRKRLKLTQQEFADRLGVSRSLVIRGEQTAPSVLLVRAARGLLNQETLQQLRLQVQEQGEFIKVLTLAYERGPSALAVERERLQQKNADLRTAIKVIAALDKSKGQPA